MPIIELAQRLAPDAKVEIVGIRPGEKLHETLVSPEEARQTIFTGDLYLVLPTGHARLGTHISVPEDFEYSSRYAPYPSEEEVATWLK
jgi:UDP-N-acetylglucosamine 4,6-dehydratase